MKILFQKLLMLLVYIVLYLPILVLILYSVNTTRFSLEWHGFLWIWYTTLLHDSALWISFLHSIMLGVSASLIATVSGCLACMNLFLKSANSHQDHSIQNSLNIMIVLIIIPDLICGVSLLVFFNLLSIKLGFVSLLIAHITFCLPIVIFTIITRIKTLDVNIYLSALDLGASRKLALIKIILPQLWPAILSAFLLCFTLSFDDVMISYFVSGPDFNILPLTIYSLVRAGVTPELNALCTITLLFSMLLVIISHYLSKERA